MTIGLTRANVDFEPLADIGKAGKNSQVYQAHDKQLDAIIAIKKIDKKALTYEGEYFKEAKILYVHEHPHVSRVLYGCSDDHYAYIAMPLYKNGSLKQRIDSEYLSVREILRYSLQFLSGLHHVHSKGLIHLDVKPDNIFLTDSDEAVLADFGLAKALDIYGEANPGFVYSKQVPPEALTGSNFDILTDIYLSGITLYRLCNGNQIFNEQYYAYADEDSREKAILSGDFPNRDSFLPHIPLQLKKIVKKCLSVDPADRYQNLLQLINDLGAVDKQLDWKFEQVGEDNKWSMDLGDKIISISVTVNGSEFAILTTKFVKASNNTTRIKDFCHNKLDKKAITKLLSNAFKDLS